MQGSSTSFVRCAELPLGTMSTKVNEMIKETVCVDCCYRYSFDTSQIESRCPICGAVTFTKDLEIVTPMFKEEEE